MTRKRPSRRSLICAVIGVALLEATAWAAPTSLSSPALVRVTTPTGTIDSIDGGRRRRVVDLDASVFDRVGPRGLLAIDLFPDVSIRVRLEPQPSRRADHAVWRGRMIGAFKGDAVFVRADDRVFATFWTTSGLYHIRPAAGHHVVRELDPDAWAPCGSSQAVEEGNGPVGHPHAAGAGAGGSQCTDDGSQVDLLVVYTEAARIAAGGTTEIEMVVSAAEASVAMAYANSNVATAASVVATHEVTYTESSSGAIDLNALVDPSDGLMDDVHDLRDLTRADVVVLITESMNGLCGIAKISIEAGGVATPSLGFSAVRLDCAVDNLTFAHELGHNQGLRHNREADASDGATPYAHGYREPGGAFRTVMAVMSTGVDRVPHFSNPDVLYLGLPTGIAVGQPLAAHAALAIDDTSGTVGNFRQSTAADCNNNGQDDALDVINDLSFDGNDNGIPDECEDGVRFVDASAPALGDGLTWATAFNDLSDAIAKSGAPCDPVTELWVAAGTYHPGQGSGSRNASFELRSGLRLYGGFGGSEATRAERDPAAHSTILDGDLNDDDLPGYVNRGDNSIKIVTADGTDETARLDGFIIANGDTEGTLGPLASGPGLYIDGGSPTIVNCRFESNSTTNDGGAVVILGDSRPIFMNCTFHANRTVGGVGSRGGAVAVHSPNTRRPQFVNCVFSGNISDSFGGAIDVAAPIQIDNGTFRDNSAVGSGGAIAVHANGDLELFNSILWNNVDVGGQDESAQVHPNGGSIAVFHSCIEGLSTYAGGGNIGDDPLFIDAESHRLQPASPCIDAAFNTNVPNDQADVDDDGDSAEPVPLDVEGRPRFVDDPSTADTGGGAGAPPVVDIGASEYQALPCPPDLDGNGVVGFTDIVALLDAWGPCVACPADLDGNDDVGFTDLVLLLAAWGICP